MSRSTILFLTGKSGSGKSTFVKNVLKDDDFYNLKSATTRAIREGEMEGREYYFRDEAYFETERFATKLFVNERFWKPGDRKWLYGVPEFEILENLGANFIYDVIEPKYVRQMIDWFQREKLLGYYDYKILWFQPVSNAEDVIKNRQNMPNDALVRKENTCDVKDFENARLTPNFVIQRLLPEGYSIYPYNNPNDKCSVEYLLYKLNIYTR